MFELSVNICGIQIIVQTDDRRILDLIAPSIANRQAIDQKVEAEIVCWITTSRDSIPHPMPVFFRNFEQSDLPDDKPYKYKRTSEGVFYKDKYAVWCLQPGNCCCTVNLGLFLEEDYSYTAFYHIIFIPMLYESLWQQSRFWLHAAGIQHSKLGPIIVVGGRDHSKSTISMAFVDAGHQLLTDDEIFFTDGVDGVCELSTLRREVHLDPDLGKRIKCLSAIESHSAFAHIETKVAVDPREFFPDSIIDNMFGVKAIIFPQIVSCPTTQITTMEPFESFWRLLCHSYTGLWDPDSTITRRFLHSLNSIMAGSVSFGLFCGADCYNDPSLYVTTIEEELINHI